MIATNVQNKAANANNLNQQANALANAKTAGDQARQNLANFNKATPAPNFSPGAPPTATPGPTVGPQPGVPQANAQAAQANQQAQQMKAAAQRKAIMARQAAAGNVQKQQQQAAAAPPNASLTPEYQKILQSSPSTQKMAQQKIMELARPRAMPDPTSSAIEDM
jgi:hypothetical protein